MPLVNTHPDQLPSQCILTVGAGALSNEDLLAVVLGADARVVRTVMERFSIRDSLWDARADELMDIEGVSRQGAVSMLACLELSRRGGLWRLGDAPLIRIPEDVVRHCAPLLRGSDREHFWMLCLDTRNRLAQTIEVSVGSLDVSVVHPRELFRDAIRHSAATVVLVHNHPSGDPLPSPTDLRLTTRLVEAGSLLGIEVLDHVIIGSSTTWTSMQEAGLIDRA